jgi:hypothetical protein
LSVKTIRPEIVPNVALRAATKLPVTTAASRGVAPSSITRVGFETGGC